MQTLKRRMSSRLGVVLTLGALLMGLCLVAPDSANAGRGDRTLKLYFTHTKERGEFTFRRNGRYDKKELERINVFLRDWRRGEPTKMDPQLLDLVWEVYQQSGANDYIHVVSAYRSLETNNKLRSRSRGVAQRSQHTRGKALDFFVPGVPVAKLRAIGLKMQRGGVGYYPSSGSPFVHLDTGTVRHWPRMTRKQLVALFPNGETLHVPTDGKPLPGYERAAAKYKAGVTLASASAAGEPGKAKDRPVTAWLKGVFGGGADEEEDNGLSSAPAAKPAPVKKQPAEPAQVEEPAEPVIAAQPEAPAEEPAMAEPPAPVEPEPPAVMPAPRPAAPEIAIASADAAPEAEAGTPEADAAAPLPREAPLLVRQILLAANERAAEIAAAPVLQAESEPQMTAVDAIAAQAASGGGEEPAVALAFAAVPKGRPARKPEPAEVAADGDPAAALDALFATSQGGNPEGGPLPAEEPAVAQETGDPEELLAARTEAMQRLASIDFDKPLTGMPLPSPQEAAVEEEAPRPQLMTASLSMPLDDAGSAVEPAAEPEIATGEDEAFSADERRLEGLSAGKIATDDLARFMSERNARSDAFAVLAMPSPAGASGLFTAAEDASSVQSLAGSDGLRTDRFAQP